MDGANHLMSLNFSFFTCKMRIISHKIDVSVKCIIKYFMNANVYTNIFMVIVGTTYTRMFNL